MENLLRKSCVFYETSISDKPIDMICKGKNKIASNFLALDKYFKLSSGLF